MRMSFEFTIGDGRDSVLTESGRYTPLVSTERKWDSGLELRARAPEAFPTGRFVKS